MKYRDTGNDYSAVIPFLNGFDDDYLNALLQGNKEGVEYLLRIVLKIPDLVILKNPVTQQDLKNIYGKSIRMDCYAESIGKRFNVEIQRRNKGAGAHRARFNASLMDASFSVAGEDYDELPDTYVIFITEHDIYKAGKPYYVIERVIKTLGIDFCDGSHILYVNGEYEGNDPIGWLMHDLHCTNPHDMHEGPLKERALFLKETKEGVRQMSDRIEKIRDEGVRIGEEKGRNHEKKTVAMKMIANGEPVNRIQDYTGLSSGEINSLKQKSRNNDSRSF